MTREKDKKYDKNSFRTDIKDIVKVIIPRITSEKIDQEKKISQGLEKLEEHSTQINNLKEKNETLSKKLNKQKESMTIIFNELGIEMDKNSDGDGGEEKDDNLIKKIETAGKKIKEMTEKEKNLVGEKELV